MHLILAGDDPETIIGNYIADHIRGVQAVNELPNAVKRGVLLHRAIDTFSDMHHAVRHSVTLLRPSHKHYAPVAVDILYDHFLIKNWKIFVREDFSTVVNRFYQLLEDRMDTLPPKSQRISRKIIDSQWFDRYETFEGMQEVFSAVNRRTHFKSALADTVQYLVEFYHEFENDFLVFTPDIITFVSLHKKYRL